MAASETREAITIELRLSDAISRAQGYLLAQQDPEGYWWAELEANVTLTAEYIMLHRILGTDRDHRTRAAARYLLGQQRENGGWELFFGDGGELSTTIEAYWALKLAGFRQTDEAMIRARKFILARGGLSRA